MKLYSAEARILALRWEMQGKPTPTPLIRRARILALPPDARAQFLTEISKINLLPCPARRKAIDAALLQAEWDAGLITPETLFTYLSLRIIAKNEPAFKLRIPQGTLRTGVDGHVVRLRWFKGRLPKTSLVLARHIGGEWKMEAEATDLIKFIREIKTPPHKTEPWQPDAKSRRGRVGSLPSNWRV